MEQRTIGDRQVGAIGLGALPLSVEGRPPRRDALRTICAALDAGVTLIDTADCYSLPGPDETGHGERLVSEAIALWGGPPGDVLVATKGGQVRAADGSYQVDARPERLRAACEASLRALRCEAVDLYQLHAVDPGVPFLESLGALTELRQAGKIRMAGLSNVTAAQIEQARTVLPIASVQNRYSVTHQDNARELAYCTAAGVAFLPWAPLGGLAAAGRQIALPSGFGAVAAARGWSVQRVCLAWLLTRSPVLIPIPGTSRAVAARENAAAGDQPLTSEELALLGPGAGS